MKCSKQTEVYSRIVGYFRPVQNWNIGKKQEFTDRKEYGVCESCLVSDSIESNKEITTDY